VTFICSFLQCGYVTFKLGQPSQGCIFVMSFQISILHGSPLPTLCPGISLASNNDMDALSTDKPSILCMGPQSVTAMGLSPRLSGRDCQLWISMQLGRMGYKIRYYMGCRSKVSWFCYCSTGNFIGATPCPSYVHLKCHTRRTRSEVYADCAMNFLPINCTLN
jgi:hypothetical protein